MSRPPVPLVRVPVWCTTDDLYSASGEDWHNKVRIVDPAAVQTAGWAPDDQPAAQEDNWRGNAAGQWLDYLSDIQLQNFTAPATTGSSDTLVRACYSTALGHFVAVGENGKAYRSPDGLDWTSITTSVSTDFTYVFASTDETVALAGDDVVSATTTGSNWISNTETTNDDLHVGVYDTSADVVHIAGILPATNLVLFLRESPGVPGVSDMTRHAGLAYSGNAGADKDTILGNVSSDTMHIAEDGEGRVLCLLNAQGGSSGAVDQYVTSDGGVTWTASLDVVSGVTSTLTTGVASLAHDEMNSQWVAVTEDGRVFTAPVGSESWTLVVTLTSVAVSPGSLNIVGAMWLMAVLDSGPDRRAVWSLDAGLTWRQGEKLADPAVWITYSSDARCFVLGQTTNFRRSLCVGTRPTVATS